MTELENEIVSIIKKSLIADRIDSVALFGSYAKGTQTKSSDIDILLYLNAPVGLSFIKLERELSDKIGKKIELYTEGWISKYLLPEIQSTKKIIYER